MDKMSGFRGAVGCRYVTTIMRLSNQETVSRCRDNAKRLLLQQTLEWGNDLKVPNKLKVEKHGMEIMYKSIIKELIVR